MRDSEGVDETFSTGSGVHFRGVREGSSFDGKGPSCRRGSNDRCPVSSQDLSCFCLGSFGLV